VKNGRATYQRVLTWIVTKVSRSILKAGSVVIAFLVTGKFVISALVMLLLVCPTDVTHIALATDRAEPSQKPETWNIGPLVRVAGVVGVMTLIVALGLLALGWRRFGLSTDAGTLSPLPLAVSALIFGYGAACSLAPNDLVKAFLCARALRRPRSAPPDSSQKRVQRTPVEHPS